MEEDKKLDAKTERASGKSGSVEEIGFGLAQKDKRNEGKEEVGGSEGGRQGEAGEKAEELEGEREGGIRRISVSVGQEQ